MNNFNEKAAEQASDDLHWRTLDFIEGARWQFKQGCKTSYEELNQKISKLELAVKELYALSNRGYPYKAGLGAKDE